MKDCNETRLQQAATEKDPDKLALLMREFDLMLEERQR